jgi:hypothetical protein
MATPAINKTYPSAPQVHNLKTYDERYAAGKALRESVPPDIRGKSGTDGCTAPLA